MASQVTREEIKVLKQKFEDIRKRVKNNPAEAKRILHAYGITNKDGKLRGPYRTPPTQAR